MRRALGLMAGLLTAATSSVVSQQIPDSPEAQVEWALSAGPPHVQVGAEVWVLSEGGYEVAREGTNGFTCLLERWHMDVVTPICYDPIGTVSTLQVVRYLEARRSMAIPEEQILQEIEEGYERGRFRVPVGLGVAYMLSEESPAPPHVMYYAPYMKNADFLGADRSDRGLLPFVYDEGTPRAYIVQLVDRQRYSALVSARQSNRDATAKR